jgi:hypothetical protein
MLDPPPVTPPTPGRFPVQNQEELRHVGFADICRAK